MDQTFNKEARDELGCIISRMFYTSGLSFNLTRNSWYVKAFKFTAHNSIAGYKPLGYNSLRIILLQREKSHIERLMESIKSTWKQNRSKCDGWADTQRSIINFITVIESGAMFLNTVNAEREVKIRESITDKLENCIKDVGAQNGIQIITDNASACKTASATVKSKYPHIF